MQKMVIAYCIYIINFECQKNKYIQYLFTFSSTGCPFLQLNHGNFGLDMNLVKLGKVPQY